MAREDKSEGGEGEVFSVCGRVGKGGLSPVRLPPQAGSTPTAAGGKDPALVQRCGWLLGRRTRNELAPPGCLSGLSLASEAECGDRVGNRERGGNVRVKAYCCPRHRVAPSGPGAIPPIGAGECRDQTGPRKRERDSRKLARFVRDSSTGESDMEQRPETQIVQSRLDLRDFLP